MAEYQKETETGKHTPGQDSECHICGTQIAWVERPYPKLSDWQVCPLHAAAADLLAALEEAEPWLMRLTSEVIDGEGIRTEYAAICAQARAAIAKAKGN